MRPTPPPRLRKTARRPFARPCLEGLEERVVPSRLVVVSESGSGQVSAQVTQQYYETNPRTEYRVNGSSSFGDGFSFVGPGAEGGSSIGRAPGGAYEALSSAGIGGAGYFFLEGTVRASASGSVSLKIEAEEGDDPDAEVLVQVGISILEQGGGSASASVGSLSRSGEFRAKLGETFGISLNTSASVSGGPQDLSFGKATVSISHVDVPPTTDLVAIAPSRQEDGTVWYGYQVDLARTPYKTAVSLYWAAGESFGAVIGDPIETKLIPAGTPRGTSQSFKVDAMFLATPPEGATHLLTVVDPGDFIAEAYEGNNAEPLLVPLPDVKPLGLSWDAERKGVEVRYEVKNAPLPADATFNLYWAKGTTKLTGPLLQFRDENKLNRQVGKDWEAFVSGNDLLAPPADATHLLLEVDAGKTVTESDEKNNLLELAYDPRIESITATHDGDASDDVIGRFFAKVPVSGQQVSVRLSESLAVVARALRLQAPKGALKMSLVPGSENRTWTTNTDDSAVLDPGALDEPTTLTVVALGQADATLEERDVKVDVVPLPRWLSALGERPERRFDPATKSYVFGGPLLDVKTSQLFPLTADEVWFGKGLSTGLDVTAGVEVIASLDPSGDTAKPEAKARLDAVLKVLGEEKAKLQATTGGNSPLKATFDLDPKTLTINSATLSYTHTVTDQKVTLLKGKEFAQGVWAGQSEVELNLDYTVKVDVTLADDGKVGGTVNFDVGGELSGTLAEMKLNVPSAFGRVAGLLKKANPGSAIASELWDIFKKIAQGLGFEIPEFKVKANVAGQLWLSGEVKLLSGTQVEVSQ